MEFGFKLLAPFWGDLAAVFWPLPIPGLANSLTHRTSLWEDVEDEERPARQAMVKVGFWDLGKSGDSDMHYDKNILVWVSGVYIFTLPLIHCPRGRVPCPPSSRQQGQPILTFLVRHSVPSLLSVNSCEIGLLSVLSCSPGVLDMWPTQQQNLSGTWCAHP